MPKKRTSSRNSLQHQVSKEQPLNATAVILFALVGGAIFITISVWLRTPANKTVHLATHKTPKKIIPAKRGHTVQSYVVKGQ